MFGRKVVKLYLRFMQLPLGKKIIASSFLIWLLQAIPKFGFVVMGDGEMAASIMKLLITPRSEL